MPDHGRYRPVKFRKGLTPIDVVTPSTPDLPCVGTAKIGDTNNVRTNRCDDDADLTIPIQYVTRDGFVRMWYVDGFAVQQNLRQKRVRSVLLSVIKTAMLDARLVSAARKRCRSPRKRLRPVSTSGLFDHRYRQQRLTRWWRRRDRPG